MRSTYFESHLETLLERDLRLIQATTLTYDSIRSVLAQVAQNQGEPVDYAATARSSQISVITLTPSHR